MTNMYIEPKSINKEQFINVVSSGDIPLSCEAIVNAVHYIDDYEWLIQRFFKLLKHDSVEVRGVTITCIGHLARLNDEANKEQLLDCLHQSLSDKELVGRVEDAMDDVNMYLS